LSPPGATAVAFAEPETKNIRTTMIGPIQVRRPRGWPETVRFQQYRRSSLSAGDLGLVAVPSAATEMSALSNCTPASTGVVEGSVRCDDTPSPDPVSGSVTHRFLEDKALRFAGVGDMGSILWGLRKGG
jgi:hypothetical protein